MLAVAAPIAPTAVRQPAQTAMQPRGTVHLVPKAAPTPPLTRSSSSSPSSSTLHDDDNVSNLADDLKLVYATGLDALDLDLDEVHTGTALATRPLAVRKKSLLGATLNRTSPRSNDADADSPSSSSSSSSSAPAAHFVPNPHAVHYLPTIVRRRHAADPRATVLDARPEWAPHRPWRRAAKGGAVATYTGVQRSYASKVVDAGPWDTAMLSELAAQLVELAAEGTDEEGRRVLALRAQRKKRLADGVDADPSSHLNVNGKAKEGDAMKNIAQFACALAEAFATRLGEDSAKTFCQLLKQTLLSEYRAWWLSTLTSSIALLPTNSPSPPHAHPARLLTSALGIASFVGSSFAAGLTSGSYIMLCLNILLERLSVLEELAAVQAIVRGAGDALIEHANMDAYLAELKVRVSEFGEGASVLGRGGVRERARVMYEDIEKTIHDWTAPSASSPEFSDTATEYSDYNPEFTIHRNGIFAPSSPQVQVPASSPSQAQGQVPASSSSQARGTAMGDSEDAATMPPPGLLHPSATVRPGAGRR